MTAPAPTWRRAALLLVASAWIVAGTVATLAPQAFYAIVPGLPAAGPFNAHLVRDVGLAFLASGATTGWGAWHGSRAATLAGTTWPALHALSHLRAWAHRGFPLDGIAAFDAAAVVGPALVALGLAGGLCAGRAPADADKEMR